MDELNFNSLVDSELKMLIAKMKRIWPNHEPTPHELSRLKAAATQLVRNRQNDN